MFEVLALVVLFLYLLVICQVAARPITNLETNLSIEVRVVSLVKFLEFEQNCGKMASNEQKAQQLIAEAEKKISPKGFFGALFG